MEDKNGKVENGIWIDGKKKEDLNPVIINGVVNTEVYVMVNFI